VDHDFAEKAFAGGGNFSFTHAASLRQKSDTFNSEPGNTRKGIST
jgi:hypothetical protein